MTSTLAWEATPAYVIGVTRETSAAIEKVVLWISTGISF